MFIYIKNFFIYLLDFCKKDLSSEDNYRETSDTLHIPSCYHSKYKETCDKMPSKYIHHLENPEDYYYHPFEF
jgi:hypothetical protein